ncbi:MAG: sodium-dependent transporter [Phycisphaerales bacterium]
MTREHWGSRAGFVMAAAGSAVGLGNIWKFPYVTGDNGGGAFLLVYLGLVFLFGVSLVMAELVIGRTAQRDPIGTFRKLAGGAWPLVGMLGVFTGFVILSFYSVVAGWTMAYVGYMASGALATTDPQALGDAFTGFIGEGVRPVVYAAAFMVLTALVVVGGIGRGIERAAKLLMPVLFLLLIVLVVRSVTLPGAMEGVRFYLTPDFSRLDADAWGAAIGQAFFSLSLGMGALITYGSYMSRQQALPSSALSIVALDTTVALLAGLMILPAVFAFSLDPGEGAGLAFVTLPAVFASMPAGTLFGVMFFTLLTVAALTSSVSLLEVVVTYLVDEWSLSRRLATFAAAIACFLAGVPSALSQGAVEGLVFADVSFLDWMTRLTDLLLPLGGLFIALFVGWVMGPAAVTAATDDGRAPLPLARVWLWILRVVAPVGIGFILINTLLG